jgi:rhodanese-related sulfurtransferase
MHSNTQELTPQDIRQQLDAGEALLVDVRGDDEWRKSHAKSAMHLSVDRILDGELPTDDTSKAIYLYCASGNRAGMAAQVLEKHGFTAHNIGGLRSWQAAGGEVEQ